MCGTILNTKTLLGSFLGFMQTEKKGILKKHFKRNSVNGVKMQLWEINRKISFVLTLQKLIRKLDTQIQTVRATE